MFSKYVHKAGNGENSVTFSEARDSCCVLRQISFFFFFKSAECFEVAPTLFSLLRSALRTKTSRRNEGMIIVVIAGIISKHRRSCCSLVQQMVSLVLYAGHASKQVSIGNQS